jgi:hypothetical protein
MLGFRQEGVVEGDFKRGEELFGTLPPLGTQQVPRLRSDDPVPLRSGRVLVRCRPYAEQEEEVVIGLASTHRSMDPVAAAGPASIRCPCIEDAAIGDYRAA